MVKKYKKLHKYFVNSTEDNIKLTFKEVEDINETKLPLSAKTYREFWANHIGNSIAKSWMLAGYKIDSVDLLSEIITFVKIYQNQDNISVIKNGNVDLFKSNINNSNHLIIEEIKNIIIETSSTLGMPLDEKDFYILYQPKNHIPKKLPKKKMAVYSFVYNGVFLKIGQAGSNSNARYESQHYYPNSTNSNLAKSLLNDPLFKDFLSEDMITNWIRKNCERYDIIIDAHYGKNTLNYIEGLLHKKYNPKYEG